MKIRLSIICCVLLLQLGCQTGSEPAALSATDSLAIAESYFGLSFNEAKRDSMVDGVRGRLGSAKAIHNYKLENENRPALFFNPVPVGFEVNKNQREIDWNLPANVVLPENMSDLSYYSVAQLASLIKQRKVTSLKLTEFFINRLKTYGDTLQCIITLTEDRALAQAKKADEELASGLYRGPLHGIPYGAKDLLALDGYKTTWGAMPYKDQEIEGTATVVKKLDEAGAVLVAKLTLGALAMGDIWYGGVTKNPWDLEQGSSGSSAGSASATSAGLVPFAIGTETLGSIVSPSTRCGTTGLRPSFGRVSKTGAMALSWTMDKIGPICRSAKDAAMVFDVIRGADPQDQSLIAGAFNYTSPGNLGDMKIGYFKSLFEEDYPNKENDNNTLNTIRDLGANLEEVNLPQDMPFGALTIILAAEAAGAFDELTRSGQDDLMVNQKKGAWPNYFRSARYISAVDYVNANRIRFKLVQEMHEILKKYDAVVAPSFGGPQLVITNLTGNPCVVMPNGFDEKGHPASISIIGKLYNEAEIIQVAEAYQSASEHEDKHPEMFLK